MSLSARTGTEFENIPSIWDLIFRATKVFSGQCLKCVRPSPHSLTTYVQFTLGAVPLPG